MRLVEILAVQDMLAAKLCWGHPCANPGPDAQPVAPISHAIHHKLASLKAPLGTAGWVGPDGKFSSTKEGETHSDAAFRIFKMKKDAKDEDGKEKAFAKGAARVGVDGNIGYIVVGDLKTAEGLAERFPDNVTRVQIDYRDDNGNLDGLDMSREEAEGTLKPNILKQYS